jgi:hypothetical protein
MEHTSFQELIARHEANVARLSHVQNRIIELNKEMDSFDDREQVLLRLELQIMGLNVSCGNR